MKRLIIAISMILAFASMALAQSAVLTGALIGTMAAVNNSTAMYANQASQEPDTDYTTAWYYDQGPLKLKHFQARRENEDLSVNSELYWFLERNPYKAKVGNMKFYAFNTKVGMDMMKSWYTRGVEEEWSLRYNQMIFNMVEVNRRELQNKLNDGKIEYSTLLNYYGKRIQSTEENILFETKFATDTTAIKEFEIEYRNLLEQPTEVSGLNIPQFEKKNWGMGIFYNIGYEQYTDDNTNITSAMLFPLSMAMELYINKLLVGFDLSLGTPIGVNPELGKSITFYDSKEDWNWTSSESFEWMAIDFRAGYRAFDNHRWTICPYIGVGHGFFEQRTDKKGSNNNTINSYLNTTRLLAGTSLRFKFRRTTAFSPEEYDEGIIPINISLVRSGYGPCKPSLSVMVSTGIGVSSWILK